MGVDSGVFGCLPGVALRLLGGFCQCAINSGHKISFKEWYIPGRIRDSKSCDGLLEVLLLLLKVQEAQGWSGDVER